MKSFLRISLILMLLGSCKPSAPVPVVFSASDLPSQFVKVNILENTTLQLAGGTVLIIPANALKGDSGTEVKLEVKEAVTIEDMIIGGLRTQNNGRPLMSGGMIYINAPGVKILKPIQVKIPANDIADGMMLYKGEDGTNWVNPAPLPAKNDHQAQQLGKAIFIRDCSSCHAIDNKITGPPLYGTMQRWLHDTAAVFRFTRDNIAEARAGNRYACCLLAEFNQLAMPAYNELSDTELESIYHYIDQEGKKKWGTVPAHLATSDCSSCLNTPMPVAAQREIGVTETLPAIDTINQPFYTTVITSFGWYNIDRLLEGFPNCKPTKVTVHITGQEDNVSLLLIIPKYNILLDGVLSSDGETQWAKEGDLFLQQGITAYVVAISPQISFGLKKFTIGTTQSLTIPLKPATKEDIYMAIKALHLSAPEVPVPGAGKCDCLTDSSRAK